MPAEIPTTELPATAGPAPRSAHADEPNTGTPMKVDGAFAKTTMMPPIKFDPSARRMSHCQAWEDGCEYAQCPRWRDGKIINEAHCALDLIEGDDDSLGHAMILGPTKAGKTVLLGQTKGETDEPQS